MAWTHEEINKLIELCEAGISNKAIAAELDKPITDIYAKRSQMCITIDKVPNRKAAKINQEFEEKAQLMDKEFEKSEMIKQEIENSKPENAGLNIKDNYDAVGGYRILAELYFGEPKNNHEKTIKTLLKGAAAKLERTTKHLEYWIKKYGEEHEE